MEVCAELGFTLENVEGVDDIKPKALGMRGQEVDFDILEIGDRPSELKIKDEKRAMELKERASKGNRVNLGNVADESKTHILTTNGAHPAGLEGDFVSLDFGGGSLGGQEFESLNYNHKLRRKLHRAIEAAQIQKELLVRSKAKEHCVSNGIPVPPELAVEYKPIKLTGRRILEDGTLETEKQERVRKRLELAEYNKAAKVLRQQAKAEAIEAGLRVFAELTSKRPANTDDMPLSQADGRVDTTVPVNAHMGQDDKEKSQQSKKRQRDGDESDTNKPKRSRKFAPNCMQSSYTRAGSVHEEKKAKNKKQTANDDLGHTAAIPKMDVDRDTIQKERKRSKKHLKSETLVNEAPVVDKVDPPKTVDAASKDKQAQSPCMEEKEKATQARSKKRKTKNEEEVANIGDQWNPDALNGDIARKDKFLRLLGASKVNGTEKRTKKVKSRFTNYEQMENDLEQQFEAGVSMKHNGQGRRGLGA
jgi:Small acidic protein family